MGVSCDSSGGYHFKNQKAMLNCSPLNSELIFKLFLCVGFDATKTAFRKRKRNPSLLLYLRLSRIFPSALEGLRPWFIGRTYYDFLLVQPVTVLLLPGHTHTHNSSASKRHFSGPVFCASVPCPHVCPLSQRLIVLKRVIMVCFVKRCHFRLPFSLGSWFSK